MKKLLVLLTVCIALTSCSNVGNNSSSQTETNNSAPDISADQISNEVSNGYKYEEIPLPDGFSYAGDMISFPDSDRVMIYCYAVDDSPSSYFETTKDFSDYKKFSYELPEETADADYVYTLESFNPDWSFFSIVVMEDHSGIQLPDEYDENFDYDAYNSNCITTYLLCKYDADGNLLSKVPFEYPEEFYDDAGYLYFGDYVSEGDSLLVSSQNGKIFRINGNGEFTQIFLYEGDPQYNESINFYTDRDSKIIAGIIENSSENGYVLNLCEINDDDSIGEPLYILEEAGESVGKIMTGNGKYRLYIPKYDGLYGITDNNECEMIIDYEDIGLMPGVTINIGENQYLTSINGNSDSRLCKIRPREPGELAEAIEITIGSPYSPPREIMNAFNNSQDKYKIKSQVFTRPNDQESYSPDNTNLNLAILSGEAPDIIYGLNYSTYLSYQNKGVFTDLYPLMENDSTVNKNTILPNYLKAMEASDGAVYGISGEFDIGAMIAKTSICDKENWTLDDMIDLYENPPVNAIHRYDSYNKEEMLRMMFYCMDELIDYKTATCNFDSPYFIKMLEFCNRFVDVVPKPDKMNESAEFSQYYADRFRWFEQDLILTDQLNLNDTCEYAMTKYLSAGGADMTIVGYPTSNGTGGRISPKEILSVTENSDCKEGAWAFISYYIDTCRDDDPYGIYGDGTFPVLSEDFEKLMDHSMNANRTASGETIPNLTQEERDMLENYIASCDTLGFALDDDVEDVCMEEAGLYFAGEQTAEQAAEHIQNRVSIIISEKS